MKYEASVHDEIRLLIKQIFLTLIGIFIIFIPSVCLADPPVHIGPIPFAEYQAGTGFMAAITDDGEVAYGVSPGGQSASGAVRPRPFYADGSQVPRDLTVGGANAGAGGHTQVACRLLGTTRITVGARVQGFTVTWCTDINGSSDPSILRIHENSGVNAAVSGSALDRELRNRRVIVEHFGRLYQRGQLPVSVVGLRIGMVYYDFREEGFSRPSARIPVRVASNIFQFNYGAGAERIERVLGGVSVAAAGASAIFDSVREIINPQRSPAHRLTAPLVASAGIFMVGTGASATLFAVGAGSAGAAVMTFAAPIALAAGAGLFFSASLLKLQEEGGFTQFQYNPHSFNSQGFAQLGFSYHCHAAMPNAFMNGFNRPGLSMTGSAPVSGIPSCATSSPPGSCTTCHRR